MDKPIQSVVRSLPTGGDTAVILLTDDGMDGMIYLLPDDAGEDARTLSLYLEALDTFNPDSDSVHVVGRAIIASQSTVEGTLEAAQACEVECQLCQTVVPVSKRYPTTVTNVMYAADGKTELHRADDIRQVCSACIGRIQGRTASNE